MPHKQKPTAGRYGCEWHDGKAPDGFTVNGWRRIAKVYLPEKKMQVGILSKGDEILRKVASEVIDKFIAYLGEQE